MIKPAQNKALKDCELASNDANKHIVKLSQKLIMLVLHWQQETLLKNMLQLAISELSEKKLNKKPWQPVKRIQRIAQSLFSA